VGAEEAGEAEETLYVRAFHVEHPEPLTRAEVDAVLAPYAGRHLRMAEIDAAARALTAHYQARGYYLARAGLPAQDARAGVLRIEVAIGRYGAVRVHNQAAIRDGLVTALFAPVAAGEVARRASLERALLLAADLPGLSVPRLAARPGREAGTTDLDITLDAGRRLGGFLVYDNQGSRYTGRHRMGAAIDWNSPLGLGDQLSLSTVYGRGSERHTGNARLSYSLPLTPALGVDATLERSHYALGDLYEALDATGRADSVELGLRHTLLRGQGRNLAWHARLVRRHLRDELGAFDETTKKRLASAALGIRHEQWGSLFARPLRAVLSLEYTQGRLHFTDAAQRAANRLGADTEGTYRKLVWHGSLDYTASPAWRVNLAWSAQQALGKSLDGNEQMSIAGANAARAYRESISADSAYVVHVEIRRGLPALAGVEHSLGIFADYARGWFERPRYVLQNGVTATDAGFVYAATRAPFFARAQLAHKIGARPDERLARRDGDTHLLLQVGAVF
jgi:hemolysin activation/secretion protein